MFDEKSHSLKMDKAIEAFSKELSSLRTGRANAALLIVKFQFFLEKKLITKKGSLNYVTR